MIRGRPRDTQGKEDIFKQAEELIGLLLEMDPPHEILSIERPVSYMIDEDFTVHGRPDVIFRDVEGRLTIADVKTSARSYSSDDIYNAVNQTFTYSLAFSEPVKLKLLLFIKTKTPRLEEIELNTADIDFEEWKNRFVQTKRALEHQICYKVRGWQCKTCSFSYACNDKSLAVEIPKIERKAA